MDKYPIIVNTIEEHKKHKSILLNYIKDFTETFDTQINTNVERLNSDWKIPIEEKREYLDYFYSDVIRPVMVTIGQQLGLGTDYTWSIKNSWFQQYGLNKEHAWHNHPDGHFTNCYYIELPDNKYKTEILGIDGEKIQFEANEGDVVTIPAWMRHRSPCNGKERKTVIAFNSSYTVG
jgi:hypothetical protein